LDTIDTLHVSDTPGQPSAISGRHASHDPDFDRSVTVLGNAFDIFLDARDAWRDASSAIRTARATPDPDWSVIHPLALHFADTTLHAIRSGTQLGIASMEAEMRLYNSGAQPGNLDDPRVQWLTLAAQAISNALQEFDRERGRTADLLPPAN